MIDLELNVKIQASKQTNEELAEAFALALESYAAAIRQGGVPKQLNIKGDSVNAVLEVQATTSYINSIERNLLGDIERLKIKIASPSTKPEQLPQLKDLLANMEEMLAGMRDADSDDSGNTIRMYDLGPKGFDSSWP